MKGHHMKKLRQQQFQFVLTLLRRIRQADMEPPNGSEESQYSTPFRPGKMTRGDVGSTKIHRSGRSRQP